MLQRRKLSLSRKSMKIIGVASVVMERTQWVFLEGESAVDALIFTVQEISIAK